MTQENFNVNRNSVFIYTNADDHILVVAEDKEQALVAVQKLYKNNGKVLEPSPRNLTQLDLSVPQATFICE